MNVFCFFIKIYKSIIAKSQPCNDVAPSSYGVTLFCFIFFYKVVANQPLSNEKKL